jgi:hypothetical protein
MSSFLDDDSLLGRWSCVSSISLTVIVSFDKDFVAEATRLGSVIQSHVVF